jgi:hypothetical protein
MISMTGLGAMAALTVLLSASAAAAGMVRHGPAEPIAGLILSGGKIIAEVVTPGGVAFRRVGLRNGVPVLYRAPEFSLQVAERRPEMLPDGIVSEGGKDISAAWLTGPTRRYDHGVLGDGVEASGLRAELRDGRVLSFKLPADSVFEDRRVRLADLDGDGGDELLVVRTYLDRGAALAVLRPDGEGLSIVAETAPIGLPYRWLNPAAVADFDGDGRLEIALVAIPHIGGILKIYELRRGRLVEEGSAPGFSNHAMGSPIQAMAVVVDWGRGPVLFLPDARRRALRKVIFTRRGMTIRDLDGHQRPIVTAIVAADLNGDGWKEVVYGLDNGDLVVLSR